MPPGTRLVGRASELAALDEALGELEQGQPGAVELVGPAGIGKTRLLAELGARADARGHLVLSGSASELERDLPFWVFVDALDEYVGGVDPRRLERMDDAVRAELGQIFPALSTPGPVAAQALHERYRSQRAVRELLEQLAATQPLVLVLDDFHWADSASVDLAVAVLRRPPAARVLIALGARPRQMPERLASALQRAQRDGTLSRLELGALNRDEARELLGRRAEDPLLAALYDESGGNPFYLEQLARAPGRRRGAGGEVNLGGVEVPPMVAAALTEELTLLSDPARLVLEGAAVAGDPFDLELAAAATAMPERAALAALDELLRLDLVRSTDMPRRFRFRHPIVRRAVYETTPAGWRLSAHERAADALASQGATAAARAHHVERSARQGDAGAIAVLREAGTESALRAPDTAAHWITGALRLLPETAPPHERVELLLPLARALAATGQFAEAHAALLESLEIVPGDSVSFRVQLAATAARVEHLLGLHEQAHDRLVRALDDLPDTASSEGVALMIELAMDGQHRMDYRSMLGWGQDAAAAAKQLGDPALRAAGVAAAARAAAFAGATEQAEIDRAEAAKLVDALSETDLGRRLDAASHLAGAELYLHRFLDAGAHAERALAVGRATGQAQLFPLVYAILGMVWLLKGQLHEAVEPLDGAIEAARLTGNAHTIAWSLYARASIALAAGDLDTAMTTAQEAVDLTSDGKPSHVGGWAAFTLAQAEHEVGHHQRAIDLLETSTGGPEMPLTAESFRAYSLELLTRCHLALDDAANARRAADCAEASAAAVQLPLSHAWAERAVAQVALHTGDTTVAVGAALASAAHAEAVGVPLESALSRGLAGRALARSGDREGAIEQLERAAAEFDRLGAHRYREATERELRKLGQHIHRRSQPARATGVAGIASLTKRELQIARLIVDRRTNREIADELFLSARTVETHVRNIFRKLDADSRVEVARIVERADRLAGSVG
jgi:ATP/maltotriose-dependent transcriptional regulator MalT